MYTEFLVYDLLCSRGLTNVKYSKINKYNFMVHSLHLSQLYFYYTAKLVHLPFLIQIKIIICLSWFNLNTHLEVELQYEIIFD